MHFRIDSEVRVMSVPEGRAVCAVVRYSMPTVAVWGRGLPVFVVHSGFTLQPLVSCLLDPDRACDMPLWPWLHCNVAGG